MKAGARLSVYERIREAVQWITADEAEEREKRAEFEAAVQRLDSPDALMVRNAFAGDLGDQYLTLETLMRQHPAAFTGRKRNALDKKAQRLREAFRRGILPARGKPAMIDLVNEALDAKELP